MKPRPKKQQTAPSSSNPRRKWLFRIAALLIMPLAMLVVLEAALRLAGYDRDFSQLRGTDVGRRPRVVAVQGWRLIELDQQACTVRLPVGVEIDLGATAKALAADRAVQAAAIRVGTGVLVSLGGDISVAGKAPPGGWPIRIADDHRSESATSGPTVSISSGALATSSTTVRRWRSGEDELHHLLDPTTGHPADGPWRTVSVAAASCVDANTASTAAIVLGEQAHRWLTEHRLPARLVSHRGQVVCIGDWPEEVA